MKGIRIYKINNNFFATKWNTEFTEKWFEKRYNRPIRIEKECDLEKEGLWEAAAGFKCIQALDNRKCIRSNGVRMKYISFKDLVESYIDDYLIPVSFWGFEEIEEDHNRNFKILKGGC